MFFILFKESLPKPSDLPPFAHADVGTFFSLRVISARFPWETFQAGVISQPLATHVRDLGARLLLPPAPLRLRAGDGGSASLQDSFPGCFAARVPELTRLGTQGPARSRGPRRDAGGALHPRKARDPRRLFVLMRTAALLVDLLSEVVKLYL